jgi:hypothetical protein
LDVSVKGIRVKKIVTLNIRYINTMYSDSLFESVKFNGKSIGVLDGAGVFISKMDSYYNKKRPTPPCNFTVKLMRQDRATNRGFSNQKPGWPSKRLIFIRRFRVSLTIDKGSKPCSGIIFESSFCNEFGQGPSSSLKSFIVEISLANDRSKGGGLSEKNLISISIREEIHQEVG